MRTKWLLAFVVLLILFSWTSVFAGPRGEVGHGDDDIPELTRLKTRVAVEKILDSLEIESVWNAVFRPDREKQQELSRQLDAVRVRVPATRRYPVRSR
jgi:hypothetical protein